MFYWKRKVEDHVACSARIDSSEDHLLLRQILEAHHHTGARARNNGALVVAKLVAASRRGVPTGLGKDDRGSFDEEITALRCVNCPQRSAAGSTALRCVISHRHEVVLLVLSPASGVAALRGSKAGRPLRDLEVLCNGCNAVLFVTPCLCCLDCSVLFRFAADVFVGATAWSRVK